MPKRSLQKKICIQGHTFYKSSDCPTCPGCLAAAVPKGVFADMAAPVRRVLEREGIKTLKQLSTYTKAEVLSLHGIGPTAIPIFRKKLKEKGLRW